MRFAFAFLFALRCFVHGELQTPFPLQDEVSRVIRQSTQRVGVIVTRNQRPYRGTSAYYRQIFEYYQKKKQDAGIPLGTGFLIDKEGHLLSNSHVVEWADDLCLRFNDSTNLYPLQWIGSDEYYDIACLKIKGDFRTNWPYLDLEGRGGIQAGDFAVAIGYPIGLESTSTFGIVCHPGRSNIPGIEDVPFVQSDAAITYGNSGGPLLNLRGRCIGMNTRIGTGLVYGGSTGLAIPSYTLQERLEKIRSGGRISLLPLGFVMRQIDPILRQTLGYTNAAGVFVEDLVPDSPAEKAGLLRGDILMTINGIPIANSLAASDLFLATNRTPFVLQVWRSGVVKSLSIIRPAVESREQMLSKNGLEKRAGIKTRPLTPQEIRDFPNSSLKSALAIVSILPDSPAFDAGLRVGDTIFRLDDQDFSSLQNLEEWLRQFNLEKRKSVLIWIYRDGRTRAIPVTLD